MDIFHNCESKKKRHIFLSWLTTALTFLKALKTIKIRFLLYLRGYWKREKAELASSEGPFVILIGGEEKLKFFRFQKNKIFILLISKALGRVERSGFIEHHLFYSIIPSTPPAPSCSHWWCDKVFYAEGVKITNRADPFLAVIGVGWRWRSSGVWLISAAGYSMDLWCSM